MKTKPEVVVDFFNEGGNIFFIEFQAMMTLAEQGYNAIAHEIPKVVKENAKDYYDALTIIGKYVELIPAEAEMQDEYYANKPEGMQDGRYIADLVKRETIRRQNGR